MRVEEFVQAQAHQQKQDDSDCWCHPAVAVCVGLGAVMVIHQAARVANVPPGTQMMFLDGEAPDCGTDG